MGMNLTFLFLLPVDSTAGSLFSFLLFGGLHPWPRAARWLAPSPHSRGFQVQLPAGSSCVEFACSPRVCVGSLRVLRLPPPSKNMHVRLTGDSKLSLCNNHTHSLCVWLFVSVWPCDGLATCPRCTLSLALCQLG